MAGQPDSSSGQDGQRQPIWRSGDSVSRRVLENVLKQTAELDSTEPRFDLADLDVLLEVARRLKGVEFQLDPVVLELVKASLIRQLPPTGQTEAQFAAVADRVARTLYENPETQERLRSMWARLLAVD